MSKTAIVTDPVFEANYHPPHHIESAARVEAILTELEKQDLLSSLIRIPIRKATTEELTMVHSLAHVRETQTSKSPEMNRAAHYAVGSLLNAIDAVLDGQLNSVFAAIRPPGHHAEKETSKGYCLFNNVALAAAHALKHWKLERILIVDWDAHHGNGTQAAFFDDPRVLFFSIRRENAFPGTGNSSSIGHGAGKGFSINVNLPRGSGDNMYCAAFQRILVPVAREFKPQLILVSAGFDAYFLDDIDQMEVTTEGFVTMAGLVLNLARELCLGRILFALEGGYHIRALARCVAEVVAVCIGRRKLRPFTATSPIQLGAILEDLRISLGSYWESLRGDHDEAHCFTYVFDPDENPPYTWITVSHLSHRVARVKTSMVDGAFVVCFLVVHPDMRRRGIGRYIVEHFKQVHDVIIAQEVKHDAEQFWDALGFTHERHKKNWVWKRPDRKSMGS